MAGKLADVYDETGVFQAFEAVSGIPRGSGYNTKISDFLHNFAKEHGIKVRRDQAENVIMVRDASPGMENCTPVMLQGHMDMVCEKEPGCSHDFTKEGLDLICQDGWISANGTTLGADDGIAIAYIMALMADPDLVCPRIEAVITTDEETGMNGASALDTSDLKAGYLLNIDSEEEGIFLTSCAGGLNCVGTVPISREPYSGWRVRLSIQGLQGGHSGAEIHKNRINAVVLLGRILQEMEEYGDFRLFHAEGGNKDNAIPASACAELVLSDQLDMRQWSHAFKEISDRCTKELCAAEPGILLHVSIDGQSEKQTSIFDALCKESDRRIKDLLFLTQTGVVVMSTRIKGLVESSQNLGIFRLKEQEAVIHVSVRSSITSSKYYLKNRIKRLIELCGGTCEACSEYPAWEYRETSKLREYLSETYEAMFGKKPVFEAIHAGLECGLISEKMPDLDMVSLGPDILDIHTPRERMNVESVKRYYQLIRYLLEHWKL